jgi:hypothetical protein
MVPHLRNHAAISLYLNVFVLIVQSFERVPSLHALAPTQKERPFKIAQLIVLVLFVALTIAAANASQEVSPRATAVRAAPLDFGESFANP